MNNRIMQAMVLEQFGKPQVLKTIERPVPGAGQVLVRIIASGVNPLDLKIKEGKAAHAEIRPPAVLGIDLAGIVESVAEGVTSFKAGDEVYGMTGGVGTLQGSLAEYAAVNVELLAHKPANLSFREAAALPLIFITAWEALVDKAAVGPGQKVLVHGGAGGVGHIAVQIALARGATVFATGGPEAAELIRGYGATPIDYTQLQPEDYLKAFTADEGFDVILDTIGGTVLDNSFKMARRYTGHVVSILGWGTHSLAPLSFRGGTYSGVFTLYPLLTGINQAHHGMVLQEATKLIGAGKVVPLVDPATYRLDEIQQAYGALAQRTSKGKVVIEISPAI